MAKRLFATMSATLMMAALVQTAEACTRAVYLGPEGQTVTGRTMDWVEDMGTDLWAFPRGMERDGALGDQSLKWTSKYGSVIASAYNAGTADGMNEAGLVANMLYLAESEYPPEDDRPAMVISVWAQYLLDQFGTVEEAVASLREQRFRVVPVTAPNGKPGTVHLSISDASGDSAILQYVEGRLVIHHGREYQVMTNSPIFSKQLALNAYWEEIGGTTFLPGTNRSADRFARASFYINAVTKTADPRESVAAVFSVMRNVSVPRGITTPNQPNISTTIWRTVADHRNLVFYYEDTAKPSITWVNLRNLDLGQGSGVRRLRVAGDAIIGGDKTANFEPAEPFAFLSPLMAH
jgi:choloylglycine hydrolase